MALVTGGEWFVKGNERRKGKEARREEKKREKGIQDVEKREKKLGAEREKARHKLEKQKRKLEQSKLDQSKLEKSKLDKSKSKEEEEEEGIERSASQDPTATEVRESGVVDPDGHEVIEPIPSEQDKHHGARVSEGQGATKDQPKHDFSSLLKDVSANPFCVVFRAARLTLHVSICCISLLCSIPR